MLPQGVRFQVPPFENLMVQSYSQLQVFYMDCLHEQKFASLLVDIPLDIMRAHLHSCAIPRAGVWLLTFLTTPTFHLSSTHFLTTLCTYLGLPHPTVAHLSQCQCGHTIDDLNTHLFQCPCRGECIITHDTL
jgi:hypothetical protein